MRVQKFVTSLLLSAFVFIAIHDYVMQYYSDEKQSIALSIQSEECSCGIATVHEIIHNLIFCERDDIFVATVRIDHLLYFFEQEQPLLSLKQSIYRPPIG